MRAEFLGMRERPLAVLEERGVFGETTGNWRLSC